MNEQTKPTTAASPRPWTPIKLYRHTTDGGAEYLMDTFIDWKHDGKHGKEGVFEGARFVVRLDGNPTITVRPPSVRCVNRDAAFEAMREALKLADDVLIQNLYTNATPVRQRIRAALAEAK